MKPRSRQYLAWAALGAVVLLAIFLGVREGTHRAEQAEDASRLRATESELSATRDSLKQARAQVDTVIVLLDSTITTIDTVTEYVRVTRYASDRDDATARRLRSRADSLMLTVPPALILNDGPLVKAAYAYRREADSLRAGKGRVDAALDSVSRVLDDVRENQVRAAGRLESLRQSLDDRTRDLSAATDTIHRLRAARECRIPLIGVTCPSRNFLAAIAVVSTVAAVSR